jgi:hypothetical protein
MIPVSKIPTTLLIDHWTYGGTYMSNNNHGDSEYTWYRDGRKDTLDPHFSVVKATSKYRGDQDKLHTGAGLVSYSGNDATVTTFNGLDKPKGSTTKKMWLLRKFHVSIPLESGGGQTNGHIFYRVTAAQHVEYCGDNRDHLRDPLYSAFVNKLTLFNTWHALAIAFYRAAIQGYYAPNASFMPMQTVLPPPTIIVGPQTSAAFDSEEGL